MKEEIIVAIVGTICLLTLLSIWFANLGNTSIKDICNFRMCLSQWGTKTCWCLDDVPMIKEANLTRPYLNITYSENIEIDYCEGKKNCVYDGCNWCYDSEIGRACTLLLCNQTLEYIAISKENVSYMKDVTKEQEEVWRRALENSILMEMEQFNTLNITECYDYACNRTHCLVICE